MLIPSSEWKIMNLLWEQPMSITQITKAMMNDTNWDKHTIIVLLKRMCDRGCVTFVQEKRTKIFSPLLSREEASCEAAIDFIGRTYSGKCSLLISNLIERNALSQEEADEIRKMLQ